MKRIAALAAGAILRLAGLWLGVLAWWLVKRGLRIEAWAGVQGRWG